MRKLFLGSFIWLFPLVLLAETTPAKPPTSSPLTTPQKKKEFPRCGISPGEFPGVEVVQLTSSALGKNVCYAVFPPADLASPPPGGFPLLVLLHGLHGAPGDWLRYPRLLKRIKKVKKESKGAFPDAFLVLPMGSNGYWTNWNPRPQRWRDWVTHELLMHLEERFPQLTPLPEKRAIAGYSMGGFGALSIALQYPGLFGSAIGLSATDMEIAIQSKNQSKVYKRVFGKHLPIDLIHSVNPRQMVESGKGKGQHFYVVHGSHEAAKFREGGTLLAAAMAKHGIDHKAREIVGGTHNFEKTWTDEVMEDWLRWLGVIWSQRTPAPVSKEGVSEPEPVEKPKGMKNQKEGDEKPLPTQETLDPKATSEEQHDSREKTLKPMDSVPSEKRTPSSPPETESPIED